MGFFSEFFMYRKTIKQLKIDKGLLKDYIAFLDSKKRSMNEEKAKKRILSMSTDELNVLPDDELFEAVLTRTENIVDGFKTMSDGFNALNPTQKIFYGVGWYEMEVNNGGLCQFFVNSSNVVAPILSEYLGKIGADEHKNLFDDFVLSNGIDLSDLSSFRSPTVEDYVAHTKRYPFDDFDDKYMELEPLQTFLTRFAKENISDF